MREEGKSSVKLVITIAVIVAIVIVGINYVKNVIDKENVKNMQADLLLVQGKVKVVKGNHDMNNEQNPLKGYLLTQLPEGVNINEFLDKHVIAQEEYEKYYLLDSSSLEQMELQDLINKYKGYFIVNYENYEVIYTEGYENENKLWCYRISDLHKQPEIKQNQENVPNEGENTQETAGENTQAEGESTQEATTE